MRKYVFLILLIMGNFSICFGYQEYYCEDLTWDKAQELLKEGYDYLDGDGDGEACERNKEGYEDYYQYRSYTEEKKKTFPKIWAVILWILITSGVSYGVIKREK